MRFQVLAGSESEHCCFAASIVDTHRPLGRDLDGRERYGIVCECFETSEAELLCALLNSRVGLRKDE